VGSNGFRLDSDMFELTCFSCFRPVTCLIVGYHVNFSFTMC
jgi:hypothetical protein